MKVELADWKVEDHLKTKEDYAAYIAAAAEEGTPDSIPDAFADVFRAMGKPVEAAACDGLAAYLRATAKATMAASSPARRKTAKRGLVKA